MCRSPRTSCASASPCRVKQPSRWIKYTEGLLQWILAQFTVGNATEHHWILVWHASQVPELMTTQSYWIFLLHKPGSLADCYNGTGELGVVLLRTGRVLSFHSPSPRRRYPHHSPTLQNLRVRGRIKRPTPRFCTTSCS